jgi:hypothetical protein
MREHGTGQNSLQAGRTDLAKAQGAAMFKLPGGYLPLRLTATGSRARKKPCFVGECCNLVGEQNENT